jgi:hypothetical protein
VAAGNVAGLGSTIDRNGGTASNGTIGASTVVTKPPAVGQLLANSTTAASSESGLLRCRPSLRLQ